MGNISLQPEPQSPDTASPQKLKVPIHLCDTTPTDVVPAEYYLEELWVALGQTLLRSGCGVGSDTPNMLNMIAQIVITYHNDRAGKPLVDDTCHSKGVNLSNKIMVFLPGFAQIHQFCEILQRALDFGWSEMLIPLPFHGRSSTECVDAVFAEPSVLAATGKYPLGQNPSIYDADAFRESEAPQGIQEIWSAYREPRYARSCIVCSNVAESGVSVPNVGLVISSGVQRRVSTNIRTGSTVHGILDTKGVSRIGMHGSSMRMGAVLVCVCRTRIGG